MPPSSQEVFQAGPGSGASHRGTALFTPEALDHIIQTTVVPEVPDGHTLAVVASATQNGVTAGIVFRKDTRVGDWKVEAAWTHTFAGDDQLGTKLVWSI